MKTAMKILGVAAVCVGSFAWAGYQVSVGVQVDAATRWAYGALGSARNSSNSTEYIGCRVTTYLSGSATVSCYARAPSNEYGSCSTSAMSLVEAARAITSDSYVRFTWLSTGECASIEVYKNSFYEPK